MTTTERVVAFRKRRRDYSVYKRRNPIRDNTTIIREPRGSYVPPEVILRRLRARKADERMMAINRKRHESVNFPQPPPSLNVALVVRLVPPKWAIGRESRAILGELELLNQFSGRFVFLPEARERLRDVAHLVCYGMPPPESIRSLILAKAATRRGEETLMITSNQLVSDFLGGHGIEGLADLAWALSEGDGDSVQAVVRFLAPFNFTVGSYAERKRWKGIAGWRTPEEMARLLEEIL